VLISDNPKEDMPFEILTGQCNEADHTTQTSLLEESVAEGKGDFTKNVIENRKLQPRKYG